MRISDWSSDVCSSDLLVDGLRHVTTCQSGFRCAASCHKTSQATSTGRLGHCRWRVWDLFRQWCRSYDRSRFSSAARSEEHTSELQSLMRISYAVFCLKKKNTNSK